MRVDGFPRFEDLHSEPIYSTSSIVSFVGVNSRASCEWKSPIRSPDPKPAPAILRTLEIGLQGWSAFCRGPKTKTCGKSAFKR